MMENRFNILTGLDEKGIIQEFRHNFNFQDIYDSAQIGDTLVKEAGKVKFKLIKQVTNLIFSWDCDGTPIEEPNK